MQSMKPSITHGDPRQLRAARIGVFIIASIWLACVLPFVTVLGLSVAVFIFPLPQVQAYSNTVYASGFRPEQWELVEVGMPLRKVSEILGEPMDSRACRDPEWLAFGDEQYLSDGLGNAIKAVLLVDGTPRPLEVPDLQDRFERKRRQQAPEKWWPGTTDKYWYYSSCENEGGCFMYVLRVNLEQDTVVEKTYQLDVRD